MDGGAAAGGSGGGGGTAQSAGGDGASVQNTQGGEGGENGADPIAALTAQLDKTSQSQDEMYQWLQSQPWAQESEGDDGDDAAEPDFSFLEDPALSSEDLGATLQQMMDQAADAKTAAAIAPLQQVVDGLQRDGQIQALLSEFPEMADDAVAEQVVDTAKALAAQMQQPELATNPAFWRMTYLAGRAADQANREEGASPPVAHLEGGAGAGAGGGGQADPADAILGSRKGNAVLGNW